MQKNDILLLFNYNYWANARVLKACSELSPESLFAPVQVSFGSVLGTLAHILAAEIVWRQRLQYGISPDRMLTAGDFPALTDLTARWKVEEAAMRDFLASLSEDGYQEIAEYQTLSGKPQRSTRWKALAHVAIHGAQFRAEAGAALAGMGHSPGDLDFIYYLREIDER